MNIFSIQRSTYPKTYVIDKSKQKTHTRRDFLFRLVHFPMITNNGQKRPERYSAHPNQYPSGSVKEAQLSITRRTTYKITIGEIRKENGIKYRRYKPKLWMQFQSKSQKAKRKVLEMDIRRAQKINNYQTCKTQKIQMASI